MDLRQIGYFLGLARELHFWNAAEKMHITQSSLSRHIQALEAELGLVLFERNQRKVSLTPAGRFLQEQWERLAVEIENMHRHAGQISKGEAGEVRIGHIGSVAHSVLPELLARLSERYPLLKVGLSELSADHIERALLEFRIDLGLRREAGGHPLLEERLIGEEYFALALGEGHPLAQRLQAGKTVADGRLKEDEINLGALREEVFILPPLRNPTGYTETLLSVFRSYGYEPRTRYESAFGATILSLVAKGLGVSVLPESYGQSPMQGVRFIRLPHRIGLYLVTRKGETNPVVARVSEIVMTAMQPGGEGFGV